MSENYIAQVKCKNCGAYKWETIEKGITVKEHIIDKVCEVCNCTLAGE